MMRWTHLLSNQKSPVDKSSGNSSGAHLGEMAGAIGVQTNMAPKWMLCSTAKGPQRDSEKAPTVRVEKAPAALVGSVESRRGNSQARARERRLGSHPTTTKVFEKVESPVSAANQQRRAVVKLMFPGTQTAKPSLWVSVTSAD